MPEIELIPGGSLITENSEAGRALAVKLARLSIKSIQPQDDVRTRLRPDYANDPAMLIQAALVIATEFSVIAAANKYWREEDI